MLTERFSGGILSSKIVTVCARYPTSGVAAPSPLLRSTPAKAVMHTGLQQNRIAQGYMYVVKASANGIYNYVNESSRWTNVTFRVDLLLFTDLFVGVYFKTNKSESPLLTRHILHCILLSHQQHATHVRLSDDSRVDG